MDSRAGSPLSVALDSASLAPLPPPALLEFLRKVVANEEKNRMSMWNVSMIVAPNLFTVRGKNARQEEMVGAAGAAHMVRLLITHQDLLWTVSGWSGRSRRHMAAQRGSALCQLSAKKSGKVGENLKMWGIRI